MIMNKTVVTHPKNVVSKTIRLKQMYLDNKRHKLNHSLTKHFQDMGDLSCIPVCLSPPDATKRMPEQLVYAMSDDWNQHNQNDLEKKDAIKLIFYLITCNIPLPLGGTPYHTVSVYCTCSCPAQFRFLCNKC